MPSQDTVTAQGGIGRPIQPADLVLQPGDIPTALLRFDSYNGSIYFQNGDFESQGSRVIGRMRSCTYLRHSPRSKPGHRNNELIGGGLWLFILIFSAAATTLR